jgi:hypothetical protein
MLGTTYLDNRLLSAVALVRPQGGALALVQSRLSTLNSSPLENSNGVLLEIGESNIYDHIV